MSLDHPLRFEPIYRRYLWGGRRLQSVLDKPLPKGDDYAESWEIVDHGDDQSRVLYGPCRGYTLHQLVTLHAQQLFGEVPITDRFPLLFKFLDANRDLSLQVHPTDAQAARLDPPDLGKTEAWVILHADPGSVLYAGLRSGVERTTVEEAIADGALEQCLHKIEPEVGQCIFIPAGMPHAIGAGLVVAELQQSSDTTFRLFDWNRVGTDGKPRQLHVQQGLEAIDFQRGPAEPNQGQATGREFITRLVACNKFVIDRWEVGGPHFIAGNGRFHLIAVIEGAIEIEADQTDKPLEKGQTALLPASAGALEIKPVGKRAVLLNMYLP